MRSSSPLLAAAKGWDVPTEQPRQLPAAEAAVGYQLYPPMAHTVLLATPLDSWRNMVLKHQSFKTFLFDQYYP